MDGKGSERRWRAWARSGLAAAAGLAAVLTFAVAAAAQAGVAPVGAEGYATVDRRAQVAPSAEFDLLRELARRTGSVGIIVGLRVAFTPEGALSPAAQEAQHRAIASASAAVQGALSGTDHRVTHAFELVPLIALELSEEALTGLQNSGLAATLWIDTPRAPPGLAQAANMEPNAVGRGGRGIAVAILDTGIDRADRSLATAKVVSEACFSANGNCPDGDTQQLGAGAGRSCTYAASGCRHGTHVAAMVAGRGEDIVAIQVFSRFTGEECKYEAEDPCDLSFESDHIAGLEHVFRLHNRFTIGAASLSLGSGLFSLGCNDNPLKFAIDNLRSAGIATLIASGNGGLREAAETPGCISSAMTVPAGDQSDVAAPAHLKPADKTALPDLVVAYGELVQRYPRATDWAERGKTKLHWGSATKNIGRATAPASHTGVKFATAQTSVVLDTFFVPELGPGDRSLSAENFYEDFAIFDYGTYDTRICADVGHTATEGNEDNNCKDTGDFYVIPAVLRGGVSGQWPRKEEALVSWSGAVEFDFASETASGVFSYVLKPSPLIFTLSGTKTICTDHCVTCTWKGTAEYDPTPSADNQITLKFGPRSNYNTNIVVESGFTIPGELDCPGVPPIPDPVDMSGQPWLMTRPRHFQDPGFTSLKGSFTDSNSRTVHWKLYAADK